MSITYVNVEGNIGSGKSTLLNVLKRHYQNRANIIFIQEPVDLWESIKDKDGTTMIKKFYENQEKYAFSFQMMAYISRLATLRQIAKSQRGNLVLISERSLYTDKFIFAKMLYDQGKIEDVDYQIYLNWFDEFANDFPIAHRIYIKADPAICHERVHLRARTGEEVIPLSYLEQCHLYHEDYIQMYSDTLILNGNANINEADVQTNWIASIDALLTH
jgi:deoxyadenosine/deoxycytidine kinase